MVTIEVKGMKEIEKRLANIQKQISGDSKMYQDIGKIAEESINTNFNVGGRPTWAKRKGKYSHPILDRTGKMRDDAALSTHTWNHQSTNHDLDIKTPEYGKYHQYGTRSLVIRKFAQFLQVEVEKMKDRIRKVFLEGK